MIEEIDSALTCNRSGRMDGGIIRGPIAGRWRAPMRFGACLSSYSRIIMLRLSRVAKMHVLFALVFVGALHNSIAMCASSEPSSDPQASIDPSPAGRPGESQPDYKLGPGDMVQVFVWRNPELSVTVPIRPDGKVSTPLVDDMVANGKTPSELARDMEKVLAEYVLKPKVYVLVTGSTSASNQIKVIGQVHSPQSIPYRAGMTALDAVIAVGGLTDYAAGNRARILRKAPDNKEQSIKVHVNDLLKGKLGSNAALQPGDVLVVPESLF